MQRRPNQRNNIARGLFVLVLLLGSSLAHAATIDSSYKYAWSNVGGYVNFAPSQSPITVSDSVLTGYAWSANDGWINLSPTGSGVTNDGAGNLSGFAWDSSAGWVSFTGVSINTSTGKFTGQATGSNGYILNFDCSSCDVRTTWRPASSRASSSGSSGGSISPVVSSTPSQTTFPLVPQPLGGSSGTLTTSVGSGVRSNTGTSSLAGIAPSVRTSSTHPAATSTQKSTAFLWLHYAIVIALSVGVLVLLAVAVRFLLFL